MGGCRSVVPPSCLELAFGVADVTSIIPSRPPKCSVGAFGPHTPALGWLIPVVVGAAASRAAAFAAFEEPVLLDCQFR
jgi:hypothetical protein